MSEQNNGKRIHKTFSSRLIIKNKDFITVNENHNDYIYLIRYPEFITLNENIYKIGKSEVGPYDRVNRYSGAELLYLKPVENADKVEKEIKHILRKYTTICRTFGTEVFAHKLDIIINLINSVINNIIITEDEKNTIYSDSQKELNKPNNEYYNVRNRNLNNINNNNINILQNHKDYIYVIQTREYINKNENVYKIGRTGLIRERMNTRYPEHSKIYFINPVNNIRLCETYLLRTLRYRNFIVKQGREYFEGNIDEILNIVKEILNNNVFNINKTYNNDELNNMELTNKELDRTLFNIYLANRRKNNPEKVRASKKKSYDKHRDNILENKRIEYHNKK